MDESIVDVLTKMEGEYGIRVLFAAESGSRAWGFPSPDSDYDVRFIYVHPMDWYLDIRDRRDTVERFYPGEIDCAGWELRKALRLLAGCNLSLYEWLYSPIRYCAHGVLHEALERLAPHYFNPQKAIHHYLGTARGIRHNHLDGDSIPIKKLFYIVRPLTAAAWVAGSNTAPPVKFTTLLDAGLLPPSVEREVRELLEAKREAEEGTLIRVSGDVLSWMDETFVSLHQAAEEATSAPDCNWAPLNALFREILESPV